MSDNVNHPKHYNSNPSGVECITVVEHMKFNTGNAVKYLWRYEDKGDPIENLEKAKWYIDREIELIKAQRSKQPCRIYVCSPFHWRDKTAHVAETLEINGFVITEKWYLHEKEFSERPVNERDEIAKIAAQNDLAGVNNADVLVFLSEDPKIAHPRGGRHVEFGYALGKKPIIVLGPKENIFHYLGSNKFDSQIIHLAPYGTMPHEAIDSRLVPKLREIAARLGKTNGLV